MSHNPRCHSKRADVRCQLDRGHAGAHRFSMIALEDAFRAEEDPDCLQVLRDAIVAEVELEVREDELRLARALEAIAAEHLRTPTLRDRGSDRLDFHEVSVGMIERALRAAHALGREDERRDAEKRKFSEARALRRGDGKRVRVTVPE